MASAESVAAVIEAGGAHVPELMERLEARLAELARSHGAVLAEHAGATIAAGGKRLRPLLGKLAAEPEAYTYLPSSVKRFPGPQALGAELVASGLADVRWILTAGGIIALHSGTVG